MVHFGKTLLSEQKQEYKGYYIDYKGLKTKIKEIVIALSSNEDISSLDMKVKNFLTYLDLQINIAAIFYEGLVSDIKHQVASIKQKWEFLNPDTLSFVYHQTKSIAKLIGECFKFLELNAEGTRKILKKAEKLTQHTALCKDNILIDMLRPDKMDSKLFKLRIHHGMHRLIDEVRDRINLMRSLEAEWLESGLIDKKFSKTLHRRQDTQELVDSMYSSATRILKTTRWYYGLLNQAHIDYESEPVGTADKIGLFISNFNTFLYMVNYYIVIPTASQYSSAVGLSSISSGYLLAMTPLASLVSSVIYSILSNRSFKVPLVFCSILLCIGNFFYAIAFNYTSPTMLFIGRIIVGFGNNRSINRRYIADFVPIQHRTFHSALFVAIGALGMSVGPGLQPLLSLINFSIPVINWEVNDMTSPGWLLSVLWALFAILSIFLFKEPERRYAQDRDDMQIKLIENDEQNVKKSGLKNSLKNFFDKNGKFREVNFLGISICLWIYFTLKLTQESIQSAAPLLTMHWFNWTDIGVAYLLGIIGLLIVPANILVGWISHHISDRLTQVLFISGIILGCFVALIYSYTDFTIYQYIAGFTIIFLFAQLLEGVNMGLLSKIMPKSLSRGLFNSGFLSTEAGTAGRVLGSTIVSLAGLNGLSALQNLIIIPSIILHIITILMVTYFWKLLIPATEILLAQRPNQADELLRNSFWKKDTKLIPLVDNTSLSLQMRSDTDSLGRNEENNGSLSHFTDNYNDKHFDILPTGALPDNALILFEEKFSDSHESFQVDLNLSSRDNSISTNKEPEFPTIVFSAIEETSTSNNF